MRTEVNPWKTCRSQKNVRLMRRLSGLMVLCILLSLTGCNQNTSSLDASQAVQPTAQPRGSCMLGLAGSEPDVAIRAVLLSEGQFVVSQEIDQLMALWADKSHVTNAFNTPDDSDDDQNWLGKDAIRHRYVRTVFPGAPAAVQPADMEIELSVNHAYVRATTQIDEEVAPAGDLWELVNLEGCWLILSLTFNLEESN